MYNVHTYITCSFYLFLFINLSLYISFPLLSIVTHHFYLTLYSSIFSSSLYSESINDHFYPHQPHSQEDDLVSHPHANVTTHHSMLANERLPGPLPHKSRGNFQGVEVHPSMKVEKQLEIIYLSQLRKSPIPIIQLCKRTRRTPYNHFRRHADIKHKGNRMGVWVDEWIDLSVWVIGGWRDRWMEG